MSPSPDPRAGRIVLASDLHLGGGGAGDDFVDDGAFGRFLDHLTGEVGNGAGGSLRLVILGDLLDFAAVDAPGETEAGGVRTDPLAKLECITAAHPEVFDGLGRFVAAGGRLELVVGNHDIELVYPCVRDELCRRIGGDDAGTAGRIAFHQWIFHVPGVLYAEHGSQYHDINTFATFLDPFRPGRDDEIEYPLATNLGRFALEQRRTKGSLGPYVRLARGLIRDARRLSHPERVQRRTEYRDTRLRHYAGEVRLPHEALAGVDALTGATAASIALRIARRSVASAAPRRWRHHPGGAADKAAYLRRAWPHVDSALRESGTAVPFYVFGHTHLAERLDAPPTSYLNSGTWSERRPPGPAHGRTFVSVEYEGDAADARLRRWDDEAGRATGLA